MIILKLTESIKIKIYSVWEVMEQSIGFKDPTLLEEICETYTPTARPNPGDLELEKRINLGQDILQGNWLTLGSIWFTKFHSDIFYWDENKVTINPKLIEQVLSDKNDIKELAEILWSGTISNKIISTVLNSKHPGKEVLKKLIYRRPDIIKQIDGKFYKDKQLIYSLVLNEELYKENDELIKIIINEYLKYNTELPIFTETKLCQEKKENLIIYYKNKINWKNIIWYSEKIIKECWYYIDWIKAVKIMENEDDKFTEIIFKIPLAKLILNDKVLNLEKPRELEKWKMSNIIKLWNQTKMIPWIIKELNFKTLKNLNINYNKLKIILGKKKYYLFRLYKIFIP